MHAADRRPRHRRRSQPNLIADLTSKLGRTPQKRLEQMIDYDEEQAAAILKQWMRGAEKRMSAVPAGPLSAEFGADDDARSRTPGCGAGKADAAADDAASWTRPLRGGVERRQRRRRKLSCEASWRSSARRFAAQLAAERAGMGEQEQASSLPSSLLAALREFEARIGRHDGTHPEAVSGRASCTRRRSPILPTSLDLAAGDRTAAVSSQRLRAGRSSARPCAQQLDGKRRQCHLSPERRLRRAHRDLGTPCWRRASARGWRKLEEAVR